MTSMGSQNGFTLDEVSNGNGFKIGFEQAIRDRVRERFARERFARETQTAGVLFFGQEFVESSPESFPEDAPLLASERFLCTGLTM